MLSRDICDETFHNHEGVSDILAIAKSRNPKHWKYFSSDLKNPVRFSD